MFPPIAYLEWARRFHGTVRFDLATSGIPATRLSESDSMGGPGAMRGAESWASLRSAIATYNRVPPDEAIAALGTTHGLWLAYASVTRPGDEIVVEEPAYEPLLAIAEGLGLRVRRFARDAAERFALDPDLIRGAMTSNTRAVVITNLHNPGGTRATDADLRGAARVAEEYGAVLVVDEVYAPFDAFVDDRGVFGGSARHLGANVVAVSSLTKCYGLGQDRIGWLLGPPEIVRKAADATIATANALPLAHAERGLCAFRSITALAERARAIVSRKRDIVARWVESEGFAWSHPSEGLFGFVSVPGAKDLTSRIERTARVHGVLVTPGAFFGAPDGFRIAWPAATAELEEGLVALAAGLRAAIKE